MKNVNLLERPRLTDRYGGRILVLSTLTALALIGGLVVFGDRLNEQISSNKNSLLLEQTRIQVLAEEKKMDRRTERYLTLEEQIENVSNSRINWLPTVRGIVDYIPEGGRINRVVVSKVEPGETVFPLDLSVDLKDWFVLKAYVSMLRSHPLVKDLQLNGIDRQRMTDPGAAQRQLERQRANTVQIPVTVIPPLENQSADPFLQSLNQFLAPGASDPLAETEPESETTGPFTPEELNAASRLLENSNRSTAVSQPVVEEEIEEVEEVQDIEFLRCEIRLMVSIQQNSGG